MIERRQRLALLLPHMLLAATVIELAVYRLAVPALEPTSDFLGQPLPLWHRVLGYVGLFLFYFASVFAVAVLAVQIRELARRAPASAYVAPLRYALLLAASVFTGVASYSVATAPTAEVTFLLETSFAVTVALLVVAELVRRRDLGVAIGLLLLAVPLLVHFYGQFSVRFVSGEEGLWNGLIDDVDRFGRWTLVLAAIATPYCFAPKPFVDNAARLAPLVAGAFVGLVGALVLRHDYEVGAELAAKGLGVQLGPAAPTSLIALYLMALTAVTWTLAACLSAPAPARRAIGVGIGLVVVGGYAFSWPLQYLVGLVGLVTIARAAGEVKAEERALADGAALVRGPAIGDADWQRYVAEVVALLRAEGEDDGDPSGATATVRDEDGLRTYLVCRRRGVPLQVKIERLPAGDEEAASIVAIDVVCGEAAPAGVAPSWSLHAHSERRLGRAAHPAPPSADGPTTATGDDAFDRRFVVRDRGGLTERLLDDELRARASAILDGWLAYWPSPGCLAYRVCPGRGAPLDHPIPITELAFRGSVGDPGRLVTLLDLLADITRRGEDA